MRQKFFTNTIQSKFIKNLLLNTSLPIWDSCRDGDYLISGCTYVYNSYIIKCTKSGILGDSAEIKVIKNDFVFGKDDKSNTKVFESSYNYYDSDTHKFLGEYLRCYRDILKTDLMPFYNCFNGVYTSKFYLDTKENQIKQNNYDYYQQGNDYFNSKHYIKENFKVLLVPIKFNQNYTIAIDCNSEVYIAPCFINNNRLIQVDYGGEKLNLTSEFNSIYNSIYKFTNTLFTDPVLLNIKNNNQNNIKTLYPNMVSVPLTVEQLFQNYKNYLYLLIQLPDNNNSSIVVLEGDYKNNSCKNYFSIEDIDEIDDRILDTLCSSKLSLLNINDNIRYPYSDRLVEYLLWNVIDNNEDIGNNVINIQRKASISLDKHKGGYYDNYIRSYIYYLYRNSKKYTDCDNNGFVDKDVEAFLFK